jgi:hypothetical protein
MKTVACLLSGVVILLLVGCGSIGPGRVKQDRFDYTGAVADSWKTQMLLNLVKIRYEDTPVFLDVGQVVAGYSFQRNLSGFATGNVFNGSAPSNVPSAIFGLSGGGSYNDSPTITYTPLSGERFARSMMMALPPSSIMNVIQAGFPVDMVFRLTVQSVNGVDNRRIELQYVKPANPEFYQLLQDLRRIQVSGDIGVRKNQVGNEEMLNLVIRPNIAAAVENSLFQVLTVLGLDPAAREFRIVYGAVPGNNKEIALVTRSIYQVLVDLSSSITVPESQVEERRVRPTPEADLGPQGPIPPLIRIVSSVDRPANAFVAAPYRGYWFSIDDQDIRSKNLFSFIMFLFTFVETGSKEAAPVLTIPTTR